MTRGSKITIVRENVVGKSLDLKPEPACSGYAEKENRKRLKKRATDKGRGKER